MGQLKAKLYGVTFHADLYGLLDGEWLYYNVLDGEWLYYNVTRRSFHTKKLCRRLSSTEIKLDFKKTINCFLSHPLGDLRVTYTLHLQLVGKPVVNQPPTRHN